MSKGVDLIAAERERQITEEGYDTAHDLGHERELLAAVEAVLALHTTTMRKVRVYEPGRVSFGDLVERPFCSHCKHAGDAPHPWPCPTVQAINDALLAAEPSGSEQ